MRKYLPAKETIISTTVGFFICLGLVITPIVLSQENSKQINKDDQTKLQSAYKDWQDSAKITEINRLKFNSVALETMANMGFPPKDYDITVDSNGQFVIVKRPTPVPTSKKEQ